ncbi:MAG: formyltransferase, partial [Gammaproteobacteria bacterium]
MVFAYHDVGDRCLRALAAHRWDIPLVVTHAPDPAEKPWFASVAETAAALGVPTLMPDKQETLERVLAQLKPDFLFSFYYRNLLGESILRHAGRAAFNMHGSLLPRYRGRAPVNWAIANGETVTGATLHHMVARADAGDIVDQQSVPILDDDDARAVMAKVTDAAEIVLTRNLEGLAAGTAPRRPQDMTAGEYCGRRTPEDGRIDWALPAKRIHDLVRAVAPPYPGAFGEVGGTRWWIYKTRRLGRVAEPGGRPQLCVRDAACTVVCQDGEGLQILSAATAEGPVDLRCDLFSF